MYLNNSMLLNVIIKDYNVYSYYTIQYHVQIDKYIESKYVIVFYFVNDTFDNAADNVENNMSNCQHCNIFHYDETY